MARTSSLSGPLTKLSYFDAINIQGKRRMKSRALALPVPVMNVRASTIRGAA
jgi:hypothetical protein